MAEGKNSFVLYTDKKNLVKKLVEADRKNGTNNAGELFLHIYEYVTDTDPEPPNFTVDIAFEPFLQHLKKDLKKWESKQEQRAEAGRLGGLARAKNLKQKQAKQATAKNAKNDVANQGVSVTVTDNVLLNSNKDFDAEAYKSELSKSEHQSWRESWYMKFKVKPKSLSQILDKFNIHLGLKESEELPKDLKRYKEHFYNWCNVQERIDGLAEFKKGKKQGAL